MDKMIKYHIGVQTKKTYDKETKNKCIQLRLQGRTVTSTMEENVGTNIEIIQKLAPEAYKNRIKRGGTLDCFFDDNFTKSVADLGRNHLIIAGLTTDICLYHTSVHAKKLGYNVMVVGDACGSTSIIADDLSFERLRNNNIEVVSASQALTEL
jgi:nicotinamidase-related amidase